MLIAFPSRTNHLKAEPARDHIALPFGTSRVDLVLPLGIIVKLLIESIGDQDMTFDDAMLSLQLLQERRIAL
jgi:hypothetical protein